MSDILKRVEDLIVSDLMSFPVWEFIDEDDPVLGDTAVRPVEKKLPVREMDGRIAGSQVRLANGHKVWALLGNVDPKDPRATKHFLQISLAQNNRWFHLARYHDIDHAQRGPSALAKFLRVPVKEIFPILYDIRQLCIGDPAALAGQIEREPSERLTFEQLLDLGVPRRRR